eukprot:Phypoly_transcript_14139.p1 GENE.Phypoly_transcript_14139~~Phypoly_transcript_14139.p1  ORF type:complete len:300 (-),score=32.42 Phypoly_transcript_14139:27-926(-)
MNPPLRHSGTGLELRSRSLEMAASAFVTRDIARSRDAHTPPSPTKRNVEDEPHKSNTLRKHKTKIILTSASSGVTGIATSCFTLAGLVTAFGYHPSAFPLHTSFELMVNIIVLLVLISSGVFLAITDASTTRSTIAFYNSEKRRETWEYENYIEGEQREMVELYTNKGMDQKDAENVVEVLSKYKDLFVDIMMAEELQLSPIDDLLPPFETGISMLVSHVTFGLIPILPNLVSESYSLHLSITTLLTISAVLTTLSLIAIGHVKSLYTSTYWQHVITNLLTVLVSVISAAMLGSYFHTL